MNSAPRSDAAFRVFAAQAGAAVPLVFDSPHSWPDWPVEAPEPAASAAARLTSCDAFVDELWAEAAQGAAPVLAARFSRAFIDANRPRDDIDQDMLQSPWPSPLQPQATSTRGMGLVRRYALPGIPMYADRLTVDDVMRRITHYYDPYQQALERLIDQAHARRGFSLHINCHSMKSVGNAMNEDNGARRPDMVVSDLEGAAADPFLLRWIAASLSVLGYRVQVNHPYRGGEIVRRHGHPAQGRHSVQIEINRALYMDEARVEKHAGYAVLVQNLRHFVRELRFGLEADLYPRLGRQQRGSGANDELT